MDAVIAYLQVLGTANPPLLAAPRP
jgi:cbb3-type cytochrome oxidase cytochrome c subunit